MALWRNTKTFTLFIYFFSNHHGSQLPDDLITHKHIGSQTIYYSQQSQKGITYPLRLNGFHLYTKYRLLTFDDANEHFRVAVFGQWSNVSNAHDEAEPNLLDDTRGFGGGLIATYLKKRFAVSMTTGFTIPDEYSEDKPLFSGSASTINTTIEYGRSIEYNLSFGYLLYPKKYSNYEQANWNIYLEFNGNHTKLLQFLKMGPVWKFKLRDLLEGIILKFIQVYKKSFLLISELTYRLVRIS